MLLKHYPLIHDEPQVLPRHLLLKAQFFRQLIEIPRTEFWDHHLLFFHVADEFNQLVLCEPSWFLCLRISDFKESSHSHNPIGRREGDKSGKSNNDWPVSKVLGVWKEGRGTSRARKVAWMTCPHGFTLILFSVILLQNLLIHPRTLTFSLPQQY